MSTAIQTFRLVINGEKVPTGRCFEVLNPANEKVAGLASLARKKDLDDAVRAAETAFKKWREVPEAQRQAACLENRLENRGKRRGTRPHPDR